jgi:hypothetical protein
MNHKYENKDIVYHIISTHGNRFSNLNDCTFSHTSDFVVTSLFDQTTVAPQFFRGKILGPFNACAHTGRLFSLSPACLEQHGLFILLVCLVKPVAYSLTVHLNYGVKLFQEKKVH